MYGITSNAPAKVNIFLKGKFRDVILKDLNQIDLEQLYNNKCKFIIKVAAKETEIKVEKTEFKNTVTTKSKFKKQK